MYKTIVTLKCASCCSEINTRVITFDDEKYGSKRSEILINIFLFCKVKNLGLKIFLLLESTTESL